MNVYDTKGNRHLTILIYIYLNTIVDNRCMIEILENNKSSIFNHFYKKTSINK